VGRGPGGGTFKPRGKEGTVANSPLEPCRENVDSLMGTERDPEKKIQRKSRFFFISLAGGHPDKMRLSRF